MILIKIYLRDFWSCVFVFLIIIRVYEDISMILKKINKLKILFVKKVLNMFINKNCINE